MSRPVRALDHTAKQRLVIALLCVALVTGAGASSGSASVALAGGAFVRSAAASRGPASSRVRVRARVAPCLCTTFTKSGVIVRANAPWALRADLPDGRVLVVSGGPTSGDEVALPAGAVSVAVTLR